MSKRGLTSCCTWHKQGTVKGVGYLAEKLEVCSHSPAALHLTAHFYCLFLFHFFLLCFKLLTTLILQLFKNCNTFISKLPAQSPLCTLILTDMYLIENVQDYHFNQFKNYLQSQLSPSHLPPLHLLPLTWTWCPFYTSSFRICCTLFTVLI